MALVTVSDDEGEDFRSKPRWSAGKKMDAVLRLLRRRPNRNRGHDHIRIRHVPTLPLAGAHTLLPIAA